MNYHISAQKDEDGKMIYPYKLYSGPSSQKIALDLLAEKGFDSELIEKAQRILLEVL